MGVWTNRYIRPAGSRLFPLQLIGIGKPEMIHNGAVAVSALSMVSFMKISLGDHAHPVPGESEGLVVG